MKGGYHGAGFGLDRLFGLDLAGRLVQLCFRP